MIVLVFCLEAFDGSLTFLNSYFFILFMINVHYTHISGSVSVFFSREALRIKVGVPSIAHKAKSKSPYEKAHRLPTNDSRRTLLEEQSRKRLKRPSWSSNNGF